MNTLMTKSQLLGVHLIAASVLTLLWILICPKYTPRGPSRLETQYHRHTDGALLSKDYYRLDFGKFVAGDIVIWSAVLGVYFFIRKEDAQPSE